MSFHHRIIKSFLVFHSFCGFFFIFLIIASFYWQICILELQDEAIKFEPTEFSLDAFTFII
jgi:hypothetical protein